MLIGHKYNQKMKGIAKKSIYDVEFGLLHEFNGSENTNLELEYSTPKEAQHGKQAIKRYIDKNKMPLIAWQREKYVYVERKAICTNSQAK